MAVTALNKVQYVDQEFATAVTAIQNFISTNYPDDYNDYVAHDLGQALIDIIAYGEQNLAWYLNRRVTDLYFSTAVTPNSVSKTARMLGYKPKGATGAVTTVIFNLPKGAYTFPIPITKGLQFKGPNGLIFEYRTSTPILFNPGETSKTFDIHEGSTSVVNFISNGTTNQVYNLLGVPTGSFVESGSAQVKIDGVVWNEYPIIPFQNTEAFESNLLSSPPFIKLGDGIQGKVPSSGSGIEIRYSVVSGFKGRIAASSITNLVKPFVVNFQNIPVAISQPAASAGGDDPEDVRSITTNAPRFQRTQDRAITKSDYDFIGSQFANVAKSDAQTIRSISGDVTFMGLFNNINSDLNNILTVAQGVSGYGNVPSVVSSVSGNIASASGYIDVIDSNYQSATGQLDFSTGQVSGFHDSIKTHILSLGSITGSYPSISGFLISVINSVTGSLSGLADQVSAIDNVTDSVSGFNPFPGAIKSIKTSFAGVNGELATINSLATKIANCITVSGVSLSASGSLQNIFDYLNDLVSDGCRSNTVQVAILSQDSGRKYVAPTPTTITSLKAYLDARKDITHNVVVVAGTDMVINADMLIEVRMTDQADEDSVIQRIKDTIDKSSATPYGILIQREFNTSLYLDEIYKAIRANILDFEVSYLNVIIRGPSKYLDARGNLICPTGAVIQSGSTTVSKLRN